MMTQHEAIIAGNGNIVTQNEAATVERLVHVSEQDRDTIWRILNEGFAAINARSLGKQDMYYDEFLGDISSEKVLKYIARDNQGSIVGYLSVHIGFESINWVDTGRFQEIQNTTDPEAESYYISTIVVPPTMQGLQLGGLLIKGAFADMRDVTINSQRYGVAFFDCVDANYPTIPLYAESVAAEVSDDSASFKIEKLFEQEAQYEGQTEKQHYFSISISR